MERVDLTASTRLPIVQEILTLASKARDPQDVFRTFGPRMWRLRPMDYFITLSVRNLPAGSYKITRQYAMGDMERAGPDGIPQNVNLDPWNSWKAMATHRGGFLGEVIADGSPKIFRNLAIKNDPVLSNLIADMGSCIAVPLLDEGQPLNWSLQFRKSNDAYTEAFLEDALLTGNLIGSITRNLVAIRQVEQLNQQLRAQFDEVARVQQSLLPGDIPAIPGLQIATSYLTSAQAGGDYYDFLPMPGGRWAVLIADVSGHGAGAATIMAMLRAILHCYEGGGSSPVDVMRFTNQRLYRSRLEGNFVTAFFCVYDPSTGEFTYASAGHPPPRLKRTDGSVVEVENAATLPLGLMEEFEVEEGHLRLRTGEALVLYTDGITESFSHEDPGPTRRRDMFGESRLDAALSGCACTPEGIIVKIHEDLFTFTRSRSRSDDQTIVVLRKT